MNNASGVIILTVVDSGVGVGGRLAVALVDNSRAHQSIQLYMVRPSHAALSIHKFQCVDVERPGTSTDRYRPYLAKFTAGDSLDYYPRLLVLQHTEGMSESCAATRDVTIQVRLCKSRYSGI